MINIKYTEINVSNNTILLRLADDTTLTLNLTSIGPNTNTESLELAESLDWSMVTAGKDYHLEAGVITQTLPSPGSTYVFDYKTNQWSDTRNITEMWDSVKFQRNQLLKNSDWTQLPDVALATKEAWAAYRQLLRDITLQSDPFNITWPTPPGA